MADRRKCHSRPEPFAPCRHCGRTRRLRPRGLCQGCLRTPGVREHYPLPRRAWRPGALPCVHCGLRAGCRPRGLCDPCFLDPAVRARYPSTSPRARQGVGLGGCAGPPPAPTQARPGTAERCAVYAARAEAGWALFHPADGTREGVRA
jgi:hypothetical protein